jgi:hypothetical protein
MISPCEMIRNCRVTDDCFFRMHFTETAIGVQVSQSSIVKATFRATSDRFAKPSQRSAERAEDGFLRYLIYLQRLSLSKAIFPRCSKPLSSPCPRGPRRLFLVVRPVQRGRVTVRESAPPAHLPGDDPRATHRFCAAPPDRSPHPGAHLRLPARGSADPGGPGESPYNLVYAIFRQN